MNATPVQICLRPSSRAQILSENQQQQQGIAGTETELFEQTSAGGAGIGLFSQNNQRQQGGTRTGLFGQSNTLHEARELTSLDKTKSNNRARQAEAVPLHSQLPEEQDSQSCSVRTTTKTRLMVVSLATQHWQQPLWPE